MRELRALFAAAALCLIAFSSAAAEPAQPASFRHSPDWIRSRFESMMAVDDAYLWHDVLGGRAIHQNSSTVPPTQPLEGNIVVAQQGFFALMKIHAWDALGRTDDRLLDESAVLLDWVLANGYNKERKYFYFKYNIHRNDWLRNFYPEFNMISVAALLRYDAVRPTPRYVEAANAVFDTITRVGWDADRGGFMSGFTPDENGGSFTGSGDKTLYGAGYLAVMMLDAYEATGDARFLTWARKAVDACNRHLWDADNGAWFASMDRTWTTLQGNTKFTHIIADMVQANYTLYLLEQGDDYRDFGDKGLAFLVDHCRDPEGLWYRHTTRDGADPSLPPDQEGDGGPGTAKPYDRQMQAIVALCLGYRATGNRDYLTMVDDTVDAMERTHRIDYEDGINYGYMGRDNAQNTWCHLWGLKGYLAMMCSRGVK